MPKLESSADQKYQLSLPTVSFRVIHDDPAVNVPKGKISEQLRSFGYNDFAEFLRPEYYIRYIEPIESELKVQVEYDMDEQDQAWLDAINKERIKDGSGAIDYEAFEIILDKLEKEWFELIKRIPQPASHLPVEDSKCAICDDGEGENSNAIVFCDGCNLAVHQECYGVPYIPEGQWLCRKCTVSPENPVSCLFCPNEGGAFKQTSSGHWSHLLCAIWIPELGVGNAIYMEPVDGVEAVPKNRWKLICSLCRERGGACIQCDNRSCFTAFHVTCARQLGLLQSMKSNGADTSLRAFCEKHLPADARSDLGTAEDEADSDYNDGDTPVARTQNKQPRRVSLSATVTTKSARAHAKSYRPGPPIVPNVIVQTLLNYTAKLGIRKKQPFIERLCRYWSLKREARRGAPLLKRLHLEPWTASSASKQETEAEKEMKLKFLTKLRNDLEKVRMLSEVVRKREKEKLRQAQAVKDVVDAFVFPHIATLRGVLEKISAMDRQSFFLNPINRADVPDYYDVIEEPRWWLYIDDKVEKGEYIHLEDFTRDVHLVLDNAITYNKGDSPIHRAAKRIKLAAQPLLDELNAIRLQSRFVISEADSQPLDNTQGDLEPSALLLQALLQSDPDELSRDLLASIFTYERAQPREPTPPPPSPPPKKKWKSEAEKRRDREEKAARAQEIRAANGRATRANQAATRAFAHEAGYQPSSETEPESTIVVAGRRRSGRQSRLPTPISESTPSQAESARRKHHRQVGVERVEAMTVISDKERRKLEKAMELETNEVDPSDQFRRFNVGWVLPEGSSRRRPDRPPPPPLPPKRDRKRKEHTATASTAPAESVPPTGSTIDVALSRSASPLSSLPSESSPFRVKRDRGDVSSSVTPLASVAPTPSRKRKAPSETRVANKRRRGETEETIPVIEALVQASSSSGLSTPMDVEMADHGEDEDEEEEEEEERVEEKEEVERVEHGPKLAKDAAEALDEIAARRGTEKPRLAVETEKGAEAINAEEEAGDEVQVAPRRPSVSVKSAGTATSGGKGKGKATAGPAAVSVGEAREDLADEEDPFPPGVLVWAKLYAFPFFPAEVVDMADTDKDEDELAQERKIYAQKDEFSKSNNAQRLEPCWFVRFYDAQASYGWIPRKRIDWLGVDQKTDDMYLSGKDRDKFRNKSAFKSSNMKKACRTAYDQARTRDEEEAGVDDGEANEDVQEAEVEGGAKH